MTTLQIAAAPADVLPLLEQHRPKGMVFKLARSDCNKANGQSGTRLTLTGGTAAERVAFAGRFTAVVRANAEPYLAASRYAISRRSRLYVERGGI